MGLVRRVSAVSADRTGSLPGHSGGACRRDRTGRPNPGPKPDRPEPGREPELFPAGPVLIFMQTARPAEADRTPGRAVILATVVIIAPLALARLVLYLFAAPNYGYFRDEMYYLACGRHPAWGYVDQPPLIAWIAWILEHTLGTSLWALHLLPALAGAGTIILAGILARELGGRRWAVFLASLAALAAPILLMLSHLFTMNAIDPLLWTAIALLVARIARSDDQRLWIRAGILAGLTILNKYGVVFWLGGLLVGLLLSPLRRSLARPWLWLGLLLAALIALPNLLWQVGHGLPFLVLMHNIRAEGRDISLAPLPFLAAQAEMLGFASAVLVPFALGFFLSRQGRPYRALGWAYLLFLAAMMLLHGKMYYLAAVYPMIFAAGAVGMERVTGTRWGLWARPALAVAIAGISAVYLPTVLPVLSVERLLAWEHRLGIEQQRFEHGRQGVLPQIYADMFGWPEMVHRVADFYQALPPDVRRRTAIFGNNYGEAAAIDLFGPGLGLPASIGGHQNYWIWGPRGVTGGNLIVLGDDSPAHMQAYCTSFEAFATGEHPLSRPSEWLPIYYCRGLRLNLVESWPSLRRWQ